MNLDIISTVKYESALAMLETPEGVTPKELASMRKHRTTSPIPDPNPSGFCKCGCGDKVSPYTYNNASLDRYVGNHPLFAHGHNLTKYVGPRYLCEDRGHPTPCWIWQRAKTPKGYATNGKSSQVHRQYYEVRHGAIPDGMQLDHLCRQRDCVNPDHLEPVTPVVNSRRGNVTKLTEDQVRNIIRLLREGNMMQVEIARMYGVTQSAIYYIRNNITWKDIPREDSHE